MVLDTSFGLTGAARQQPTPKLNPQTDPPPMTMGGAPIAGWEGVWYIAHTKSRFEKALAWDLHRQGVKYFLPIEAVISLKGGKRREIHRVVFPSYLFFCGNDDDRYIALKTNRICQIIVAHNQGGLRRDLVIWHDGLVVDHAPLTVPTFEPGRRVRICGSSHPFKGMYGTMLKGDKIARIELDVEMLGRVCGLEIDPLDVEPV